MGGTYLWSPNGRTMEGAVVVTFTVNCVAVFPFRVTDGDEGVQVASEGAPVQLMVTVALNPFAGVTWRL